MSFQSARYESLAGIQTFFFRTLGSVAGTKAGLDMPALEARATKMLRDAGIDMVGPNEPIRDCAQIGFDLLTIEEPLSIVAVRMEVWDCVSSIRRPGDELWALVWFGLFQISAAGPASELTTAIDAALPDLVGELVEQYRRANSIP